MVVGGQRYAWADLPSEQRPCTHHQDKDEVFATENNHQDNQTKHDVADGN